MPKTSLDSQFTISAHLEAQCRLCDPENIPSLHAHLNNYIIAFQREIDRLLGLEGQPAKFNPELEEITPEVFVKFKNTINQYLSHLFICINRLDGGAETICAGDLYTSWQTSLVYSRLGECEVTLAEMARRNRQYWESIAAQVGVGVLLYCVAPQIGVGNLIAQAAIRVVIGTAATTALNTGLAAADNVIHGESITHELDTASIDGAKGGLMASIAGEGAGMVWGRFFAAKPVRILANPMMNLPAAPFIPTNPHILIPVDLIKVLGMRISEKEDMEKIVLKMIVENEAIHAKKILRMDPVSPAYEEALQRIIQRLGNLMKILREKNNTPQTEIITLLLTTEIMKNLLCDCQAEVQKFQLDALPVEPQEEIIAGVPPVPLNPR